MIEVHVDIQNENTRGVTPNLTFIPGTVLAIEFSTLYRVITSQGTFVNEHQLVNGAYAPSDSADGLAFCQLPRCIISIVSILLQ